MNEGTADRKSGWRLDWSPEQISDFWNWHSQQPRTQALYFSKLVGNSILDAVASCEKSAFGAINAAEAAVATFFTNSRLFIKFSFRRWKTA